MKFDTDSITLEAEQALPQAPFGTLPPELLTCSGAFFSQRVTPHKLRARQRIALPPRNDRNVYVLADGIALVEAQFDRDRPQIASILFPGDTVVPQSLPPLAKPSITCVSKHGIVLQRAELDSADHSSDELLKSEITFNAARNSLQTTVLANLTSEERLATLLIEFALRTGRRFAGGCIFEMPLARTDVALYLGLNPDTVSRNLSALRAENLIRTYGRASISCTDFNALFLRSPVASVLKQLIALKQTPLL